MKIVGIDAGGSKTRVVVAAGMDLERDAVDCFDEAILGPGNYRQVGREGVRALAREIIARFRLQDLQQTLVVGGFAGAGTAESHAEITRVFEAEGFSRKNLSITSDAGLLLRALGDEGIVLIAGTGSICLGRRPGREVRAGGYGYRLGSEAGGYYLGIGALDAALKIEDGRRQEPTALYQRVREYFGLDDLQHIVPLLYPAGEEAGSVQEKVAGLSRLVLQEARQGDRVAARLVGEAVDELADHIRAVYCRLGIERSVVGLHGGLFADPQSCELLIRPLQAHSRLKDLDLEWVRPDDRDALIQAMKFTLKD